MKIRILGAVTHNGRQLEQYEIYDINDKDAHGLIEAGVARVEDGEKKGEPEPSPVPRPQEEITEYAAEAEPTRELKPEEIDNKPVVPPTHEPDPQEQVVIVDSAPTPTANDDTLPDDSAISGR